MQTIGEGKVVGALHVEHEQPRVLGLVLDGALALEGETEGAKAADQRVCMVERAPSVCYGVVCDLSEVRTASCARVTWGYAARIEHSGIAALTL